MEKQKTMDKPQIMKKGILILLTILIVVYVIYLVYVTNFKQVKTMSAKETIAYDAVNCEGFIVHDETLISYDGNGVISYTAGDGDKVAINEPVAGVFDSVDSAGTKQEAERLKTKIDALKLLQANSGTISKTPDMLDKNVGTSLIKANLSINGGSISDAELCADDVLYYINERQIVTGKTTDFTARINDLEARYKELVSNLNKGKKFSDVKSPTTGYFVSSADGYENVFKVAELEKIMPEDADWSKIKPETVSEKVIGKTIDGVYWYAVCPVTAENAIKIKNAGSIKLDIPVVSADKISVELVSINQKTKSSDAVVILRGTYMNDEMASLRKGNFSIILRTYEGIYIPKSAVHNGEFTRTVEDKDGNEVKETKTLTGAYVKIGNEVAFREIIPVYSGEDYVICKLVPKPEEYFSKKVGVVQVYDEIIVEGANLYDGKIINRVG
ncbi:MAG: hypothetical protein IJU51_04440 [Clostridia bacterium]|nr:hypothetical protein [Clostridia bacterium]